MGLELSSPIVVSSSGLTSSVDNIVKYEQAGAGAVVLKSLFEEQIVLQVASMDTSSDGYSEAADYLAAYVRDNTVQDYLSLIKEAKQRTKMPIIASINCLSSGKWVEFARQIEQAGADGLELNVFFMPELASETSSAVEKRYLDTVAEVIKSIKIPVAVKIPNHFTNPINIVEELYFRGAKAVVLFNRFWEPDIDIENLKVTAAEPLSNHTEMRGLIRWMAKVSGAVKNVDLGASTGIESGEAVVKMILSGAASVNVCSSVYKGGDSIIKYMVDFLKEWMQRGGYQTVADFKGKMAVKPSAENSVYERAQFMKYFSSYK